MSYRFVEKIYPISDPNRDLDFGNNILYKELVDDDIDTHNVRYDNGNVKSLKDNKDRKVIIIRQKNTNNIYILFVFIVIMLLVYWYVDRNINN
jgi:hypothetical protein